MNNKTNEEIDQLIAQLRDRIQDVFATNAKFDNDFYLYRWLLQHFMKIDKAEKAIRESVEWRKKNNVEELANRDLTLDSPGLEKFFLIGNGGFTKAGQPVTTLISENLNLRSIIQKYGYDALLRYTIKNFVTQENLMLQYYKHGPSQNKNSTENNGDENGVEISNGSNGNSNGKGNHNKVRYNSSWFSAAPLLLLSYTNYSLWNATSVDSIQFNMEGARIQTSYFPAISSSIYTVNLNKSLSLILKMVKPLLNTEATSMNFFDTDKKKWSAALLQEIEEDQLTPYFGGTRISENM